MEKKTEMGICKYYGQYLEVSWLRELDPERFGTAEADYLATRSCRCSEGRAFGEREETREMREKQRAIHLAAADVVIDELFGNAAKEAGEMYMHEDVRHHISEAAEMVYDGLLKKAQVTDRQGITAKISLGTKGNLKINRSESMSVSREVI